MNEGKGDLWMKTGGMPRGIRAVSFYLVAMRKKVATRCTE
jgi:hypothetical protein